MKRLLMGVVTAGMLIVAAAFSGSQAPKPELQIRCDDRNPWTHLRLNDDPIDFHFAVVSDRTGGHRAKVFARAVEQLNLLQPHFVISVGDLIEGYTEDVGKLSEEWREFQGYVGKLQMPFFFVPGNHDLANLVQEKLWKEKFGRRYYHFVYRGVLFLMLNSEDPPGVSSGHFSAEQIAYVRKVLDENRDARWTIVALHKPVWDSRDFEKTGWLEIEEALKGRPYTVFAGHVHRYRKFIRNGQAYYQLATTGGISRVRGVLYGEFDHIAWVTMKRDGPTLANILLDGVYPEDMRLPDNSEEGHVTLNRRPVHPVRGTVLLDGCALAGAHVNFHLLTPGSKTPTRVADAITAADGSFILSSYTPNDGAPAGDYIVTVSWWRPIGDPNAKPVPDLLPTRYASATTSDLKAKVKSGSNDIVLELKR
jgi:hypothetical protein